MTSKDLGAVSMNGIRERKERNKWVGGFLIGLLVGYLVCLATFFFFK